MAAMEEKTHYNIETAADESYVDQHTGQESKTGALAEATELYGNAEEAEHYGYVNRG